MTSSVDRAMLKKSLSLLKNFLYNEKNYSLSKSLIIEELSQRSEKVIIDETYEKIINFDESFWKKEIEKISFYVVPKKITDSLPSKNQQNSKLYTNSIPPCQLEISDINVFIKFPISIGIVNTAFVYQFGDVFEKDLEKDCLGNRLNVDKQGNFKKKGFSLYKSYFKQYKSWRDRSILLTKEIHKHGNDVLLINLDLTRFFYCVDIDFTEVTKKTGILSKKTPEARLIYLLEKTHEQYRQLIQVNNNCLPIGLPSSGLLANWSLSQFDRKVKKISRASSYGRYVDDIIIVVTNPKIENEKDITFSIEDFIPVQKTNRKKKIDRIIIEPDSTIKKSTLTLNNEKIRYFYFKKNEPIALIEKFIQELNELSSEWRLMPEESLNRKSLVQESYREITNPDGSVKNLQELIPNRNALALYFEKSILSSIFNDDEKKKYSNEILEFFTGKQLMDNISFWDRAFTLLIVSKDAQSFKKLHSKISEHIDHIGFSPSIDKLDALYSLKQSLTVGNVRRNLMESLLDVCAHAASLNPSLFSNSPSPTFKSFLHKSHSIRKHGFCKRHYTILPLACSHRAITKNPDIDLTSFKSFTKIIDLFNFKDVNSEEIFHYTSFSEILALVQLISILKKNHATENLQDLEVRASEVFLKLNGLKYFPDTKIKKFRDYTKVQTPNEDKSNTPRINIGLSSIQINEKSIQDYVSSGIYDVNDNFRRISKIFNEAIKEKCELLILPENSVCLELLPILLRESTRSQMGVVFGLKHYIHNDDVFNISCTLLPYRKGYFDSSICILRPKNHFAPKEICYFESRYGKSGNPLTCYEGDGSYHLFRWRGISYTVFNCFELANIADRAKFRSKIDLLVAIEFNSDVEYFSNLIESSVRDIHCVAAQCNNAFYGDSRVTLPVRSEKKDVIKIKGGENEYVVVCNVEFGELRDFQKMNYHGQLSNKKFKPTPPGFLPKGAHRRSKDE